MSVHKIVVFPSDGGNNCHSKRNGLWNNILEVSDFKQTYQFAFQAFGDFNL